MEHRSAQALEQSIARELRQLTEEFHGLFSPETIERAMEESYDRFLAGARINVFVPQLLYRYTKERLTAVARLEGLMTKTRPTVLFVCVHNAGRSQMAAALTHALSNGEIEVRSAGSEPADRINPAVLQAMQEIGLDLSQEFPKPLSDEVVRDSDVVITMGCGDACPLYPGKRYLDWELADPAGQPIEKVRQIRDEVRKQVENLVLELRVASH
jgi:protein-tyrosine-phosphatase